MTITLLDIRFIVEQQVKDTLINEDVVNWSNDAQAEFALNINLPATDQISINTTALEYDEPTDLKIINRMWLQSDRDEGLDREFTWPYRRYNGKIIFARNFTEPDTLNIDYYKHLTYFTDVSQSIDLNSRYTPLYTSYLMARYYGLPSVIERLGEAQARKKYEQWYGQYATIKNGVISTYSLSNEPVVISERW